MDPAVALLQSTCVVPFAGCGLCVLLVCTGIMITNRAFFRSTISRFAVCLPSRSARLFSYHYMIRLVMDLACFYLHICKGQPSTSFHDGASYPIAPRYSQSIFAIDVYECNCNFCEGINCVQNRSYYNPYN